jgi:hypothetical protein
VFYTFTNALHNSQTHNNIAMADMGLKYDLGVAAKGEEQGNVEILKDLHDPGRMGTEVSRELMLCVSECRSPDAPS